MSNDIGTLVDDEPHGDEQAIEKLGARLEKEQDARREERFVGILVILVLFNIVFFTLMPSSGGPIALLILQLLILIPMAQRMGVQQIAQIIDRVLSRLASQSGQGE